MDGDKLLNTPDNKTNFKLDSKENSKEDIDHALDILENRIEDASYNFGCDYNNGAYGHKEIEGEDGKTLFIPIIMGVELPGIKDQKKMINLLKNIGELNNKIINIYKEGNHDDKLYIDNFLGKNDLKVDNRIGPNQFDTIFLSNEGLQEKLGINNTEYLNNFMEKYKDALNLYIEKFLNKNK